MHVTSYDNANGFLASARTFLQADEVINGLPLGIAQQVATTDRYPSAYFATAEQDGAIIAAAVMTPPHNLILVGDPAAIPALTSMMDTQSWPVPGITAARPLVDRFADYWSAHHGITQTVSMEQRVFELTKVIPPKRLAPGEMRPASETDIPTLAEWLEAFRVEAVPHDPPHEDWEALVQAQLDNYAVWAVAGEVVSMIGKARPSENGISVGPVYTPPNQRGRGYATHLTAVFSQHLLDAGYRFCTLFTDLANPTSNSIYQQIGYRVVCDFAMITFG
jgi:predicted GNAT family acetyltransferase